MPSATNIVAVIGCTIAVCTFGVQIYGMFKNKKKEQREIDVALDREPIIREQLELGNIGEAIKHVTVIMNSQARHIDRLERENEDLRREKTNLEARVDACEGELELLRKGYRDG